MGVHVPIKKSRHVVDFSTFFISFRSKCMIFQFFSNHRTPQHHKSAYPSFISKLSDFDRHRCRFQLQLVHIFLSPRGGPRPYPPVFSYALFKNHTNFTLFFQISLHMRTNFIKLAQSIFVDLFRNSNISEPHLKNKRTYTFSTV